MSARNDIIVRFKEDDERFKIKKGDVFTAERHGYEPDCKIVLLNRIPDGFDPSCSAYNHQVEIFNKGRWFKIACSCCN